jgi:hypothetical protein
MTSKKNEMDFHDYCLLFPQADEDVLNGMAEDIEKNGLREAIVTYEGKILDGRNRYLACQKAKVEPHYEEYEGDKDNLLQFVLSKNASRRHLSTSQRALIAAKMSEKRKGENSNPQNCGLLTQAQAASAMGVSLRSVEEAARLLREASMSEVIVSVERGDMSVNAALGEVKLSKQKPLSSTKKENKKQVEQDDAEAVSIDDEMPTFPEKVEQDNQECNDNKQTESKQPEASPTLSEDILKQFRNILRPFGDDEKKLAALFVDIVQDMAGEFIDDKCRNRFLRGLKTMLCEFDM